MFRFKLVALLSCFVVVILATPCPAVFENLWQVPFQCSPPGLPGYTVVRVYARFSDRNDRLISVSGNPSSSASVTATNGFYKAPFADFFAPDAEFIARQPLLRWTSFYTIGLAVDHGNDQTFTFPQSLQLPIINNSNMLWGLPGVIDQGAPNASDRVLIAQLTFPPGSSLSQFRVNIGYRSAGQTGTTLVLNVSPVLLPLTAGDVNHDLNVDMDDLLMVIQGWGQVGPGIPDVNDDGIVDIDDLLIIVNHWGLFTGSC
jgi:hypothetical protein